MNPLKTKQKTRSSFYMIILLTFYLTNHREGILAAFDCIKDTQVKVLLLIWMAEFHVITCQMNPSTTTGKTSLCVDCLQIMAEKFF